MCGWTRSALYPEDKGRLVTAFLESFFGRYVEYDFTADLEEKLDRSRPASSTGRTCCAISGATSRRGRRHQGSAHHRSARRAQRSARRRTSSRDQGDGGDPRACPSCGTGRCRLKLGKFGAFIGCSNYPDCRYTRQLADTGDKAAALGRRQSLGADPETGLESRSATAASGLMSSSASRTAREAEALLAPQGHASPTSVDLERALEAAGAAPRGRACIPETGKPITAGLRPLRALRPA